MFLVDCLIFYYEILHFGNLDFLGIWGCRDSGLSDFLGCGSFGIRDMGFRFFEGGILKIFEFGIWEFTVLRSSIDFHQLSLTVIDSH